MKMTTPDDRESIRDYLVFGRCPQSGILKNVTFQKLVWDRASFNHSSDREFTT
jgi:hypothetical protein